MLYSSQYNDTRRRFFEACSAKAKARRVWLRSSADTRAAAGAEVDRCAVEVASARRDMAALCPSYDLRVIAEMGKRKRREARIARAKADRAHRVDVVKAAHAAKRAFKATLAE